MWTKEMDVACQAAQKAGKILRGMQGTLNQVTKKGEIDLVTEGDMASERVVVDLIRHSFPRDGILSEEGIDERNRPGRLWILDPLDGTTNYAHGVPHYAVSLALEVEGEVILGVVYNPCGEEFFKAVRAQGAFLNDTPIRTSQIGCLDDALLATGFPYDIRETHPLVVRRLREMLVRAQGLRRAGAAALDLCYVAAGFYDGFWEERLKPWDTAAGFLIVKEAGGRVTDFAGEPYTPSMDTILATNGRFHQDMVSILSGPQDDA